MKKLFAIGFVLGMFAAQADYLYWMVDTTEAANFNYNKAVLTWSGGSDPITISDMSAFSGATLNDKLGDYYGQLGALYTVIGTDATSYWVELYNDNTKVATSANYSLDALASYIFRGGISLPPGTGASFGGFTSAVPEPTSGMLFLIGGMLLGLKRRRTV